MIQAMNFFCYTVTEKQTINIMETIVNPHNHRFLCEQVQQTCRNTEMYDEQTKKVVDELQILYEFPLRWQKIVQEMNDITDEFVTALQHLTKCPSEVFEGFRPCATIDLQRGPEEDKDETEMEDIEEGESETSMDTEETNTE